MITTALLDLIFAFILVVLSPLLGFADVVLNSNFASSIATAGGYYHSLNTLLPVDTMLEILAVSLAFEGAYLLYKLIMWGLSKVPGIN